LVRAITALARITKFRPRWMDDSFAALEWDHANATSLGANPDQIGVRGDSAGGNIASLAALLARDAALEDPQQSPRRAQC
jgi:acetyl esterase/lipase